MIHSMFKVECHSCLSSFQVDERRVPAAGLKMRCTKCGTALDVQRPSVLPEVADETRPLQVEITKAKSEVPSEAARPPLRGTMVGGSPAIPNPGSKNLGATKDERPAPVQVDAARLPGASPGKPIARGTMIGVAPKLGSSSSGGFPGSSPFGAKTGDTVHGVAAPAAPSPGGLRKPTVPAIPRVQSVAGSTSPVIPKPKFSVPKPEQSASVGSSPEPITDDGISFDEPGFDGIDLETTPAPQSMPSSIAPQQASYGSGDDDGFGMGLSLDDDEEIDLPSAHPATIPPAALGRESKPSYPGVSLNPHELESLPPDALEDLPSPMDSELPAALGGRPRPRQPSLAPPALDSELPAALAPGRGRTASSAQFLAVDLPASVGATKADKQWDEQTPSHALELDDLLPAPVGGRSSNAPESLDELGLDFEEVDLPTALPPTVDDGFGLDLPTSASGSFSLPAPAESSLPSASTVGLPGKKAASAPIRKATLDDLDLPLPGDKAGLSASAFDSFGEDSFGGDSFGGDSFGELELPIAAGEAGLPRMAGGSFAQLDAYKSPAQSPGNSEFGEIEEFDAIPDSLGSSELSDAELSFDDWNSKPPTKDGGAVDSLDDSVEFDDIPEESASCEHDKGASAPTRSVEGSNWGEVSFGEGDSSLGGGSGGIEAEFGGIPQERAAQHSQSGEMDFGIERPAAGNMGGQHPSLSLKVARTAKKSSFALSKKAVLGIVGTILILGSGAAIGLLTEHGPMGVYLITDLVKEPERSNRLDNFIVSYAETRNSDSFSAWSSSFHTIDKFARAESRYRPFSSYLAYVGFTGVVRYGHDSAVESRANLALEDASQDPEAKYLELARAAQALAQKSFSAARSALELAKGRSSAGDIADIEGLLLLEEGKYADAVTHYQTQREILGARASFGLAQAYLRMNRFDEVKKVLVELVKERPDHLSAAIALVESDVALGGSLDDAQKELKLLKEVAQGASPSEQGQFWVAMGNLQVKSGYPSLGQQSFEQALRADNRSSAAQVAIGDILVEANRFSEALARYDAALAVADSPIPAQLGRLRATLGMSQLEAAKVLISDLLTKFPQDTRVIYWSGVVSEELGKLQEATDAFEMVIKLAQGDRAQATRAYVALSRLHQRSGFFDRAMKTLAEAEKAFPESIVLLKAEAELAANEGKFDAALKALDAAQKIEPKDLGLQFKRGQILRRLGRYTEAVGILEEVAKADAEYPGLQLERGLVMEESGNAQEALRAYEAALKSAPDDLDLKLRVGCARAATKSGPEAIELLRNVLKEKQQSAEANHCLGRALLASGNVDEAVGLLQFAVDKDPNRPNYQLYFGWAANSKGQDSIAESALERAISLDGTLAEAYWQLGVLRQRHGSAVDSMKYYLEALKLKPTLLEVHADVAVAYSELGKKQNAIAEWRIAVEGRPNNILWRFRFAKILLEQGLVDEARSNALETIRQIKADEKNAAPAWFWTLYLVAAQAAPAGSEESLDHWAAVAELVPADSPFYREARVILSRAGRL